MDRQVGQPQAALGPSDPHHQIPDQSRRLDTVPQESDDGLRTEDEERSTTNDASTDGKEPLNQLAIQSNDDAGDDFGQETTLTLYTDILALRNKISRFAADTLASSVQTAPSASSSQNSEPRTPSTDLLSQANIESRGETPHQLQEPIILAVRDRKFLIPFHRCRTWDVSCFLPHFQLR